MSSLGSYIFSIAGLTKENEDGKLILDNQYLSFFYKSKIGILGNNGCGKSTLLRIMAGIEKNYTGEAKAAKGIRVGYLPQEPRFDANRTVREIIAEGVQEVQNIIDKFYTTTEKIVAMTSLDSFNEEELNVLLQEQEKLQEDIETADGWNLNHRLNMAAAALGCPDNDRVMKDLSGGELRRVALCRLLLSQPDLLLLDEPTNHLDAESVAWLEHY